jgi:hypothetical protein
MIKFWPNDGESEKSAGFKRKNTKEKINKRPPIKNRGPFIFVNS